MERLVELVCPHKESELVADQPARGVGADGVRVRAFLPDFVDSPHERTSARVTPDGLLAPAWIAMASLNLLGICFSVRS